MHLESYYSLHIGRLKVTPTLSISHTEVDVKDRIVPSYVFINPNISLKWSINSSSLLSALYSFSNTLSSSTQINTQPVLTSYNNLFFGDPAFKKFDNSFFLLSYQYNKLSKGTTLFTTFFHQNTPNPYLLDMEVKSNYIVSNFNGVASRSLTSGSINYDKYFKSISSNLKVIGGISYSSFFSSFNSIITEAKSSNSNLDISLRTALNGFFNFHVGSVINLGTTSNSFLTANSIIAQQYFDTYIRSRNTRLNIYIHCERYHLVSISNQPKFYFIDINVKYKFLDSRFTFFCKLRNLFDESIFERFDVSNQNTFLTTNQLIPRYVLVGFSMRL